MIIFCTVGYRDTVRNGRNEYICCRGITFICSVTEIRKQRIVIAKWRALNPKLLVLNCPTVGVDVGSKADIHALAKEFAKDGVGVILLSDDLNEILDACNRILIINIISITAAIIGHYKIVDFLIF